MYNMSTLDTKNDNKLLQKFWKNYNLFSLADFDWTMTWLKGIIF